jgi:hypothetical protein
VESACTALTLRRNRWLRFTPPRIRPFAGGI